MRLKTLAQKLNDEKIYIKGNSDIEITKISPPENAENDSLCVIWNKKFLPVTNINASIVAPSEFFEENRSGLACENPRAILPKLIEIFSEHNKTLHGIDKQAHISNNAVIADNVGIYSGVYVGDGCVVDEGTIVEPNAVLFKNVKVGKNCLIHSGAVIGCDGFGFERTSEGLVKIPQNGGVKIGDNVEIGACTTIDRGTMTDTEINSGTKIDNHVQIGHNVKIGHNCIICSMTGIAGSSIIEDNVTVSVQVGITDHVRIGKGTILAARTGVTNDIPENSLMSGFPARPHNEAKRALVLSADLPSLFKRIRKLEKKSEEMQKS